jgi:hypothetical protein
MRVAPRARHVPPPTIPAMMRSRSVLHALLLGAVATTSLQAQGAMRAMPSGRGTTEVTLTLVDSAARAAAAEPARIRIDYGQPHLRGRALHTDSLVPYDRVWRTGANDATTLTTDVDLTMGGVSVPKGTYVLQSLPTRAGWTLLVQRPGAAPGATPVDVARVPLRRTTLPMPVESLTFWLIPSTQPGAARGELRLAWGTVSLAADWSMK